jgi:hypothetical protein
LKSSLVVVEFFTRMCKLRWPFLLFKKANIGTRWGYVLFFKCVRTTDAAWRGHTDPTDLPHSLGYEWLCYVATSVPRPKFCSFIWVTEPRTEEALLSGEIYLSLLRQEYRKSSMSEYLQTSAGVEHHYERFVWAYLWLKSCSEAWRSWSRSLYPWWSLTSATGKFTVNLITLASD